MLQIDHKGSESFSIGPVRPEGCQDRPDSPQGPMMECPVREPCPPKCCYPDMRRSNPPYEAPGTTALIWKHQSGGGPAEDEGLNASERPWLRSVIENRPKVLAGRGQKGMRVGSSIGTLDDGGDMTRRTIGRSLPIRLSTVDNRVSPTRPATRRYSNRKEGDGGGGRGCRRKRRLRCNGGDRAARAGRPNLKGCRLPAGLSGAMGLDASTDGDVRRRKLNRPKDGCRKPPARRNQDRGLRAAGDFFPPPRRLEPCAGQLACTVLRGGGRSNAISLPDILPCAGSMLRKQLASCRAKPRSKSTPQP
jgi:hypothetical protein